MSELRHPWLVRVRLVAVAMHLAAGLFAVTLVYPWAGRTVRLRLKQAWSAGLLRRLGVTLDADRLPIRRPFLLVANHVSWVDIFAINALVPSAFVCKEEVRRWPVIGWLCARTDTVFVRRGDRREARGACSTLTERLRQGEAVALFPEGTTSEGDRILPFHGAFFQAAIESGQSVQPLAIAYVDRHGHPSAAPAYAGDTTFMQSVGRILERRDLCCRISFGEVLSAGPAADRKALARAARTAIEAHWSRMRSGTPGRPSDILPSPLSAFAEPMAWPWDEPGLGPRPRTV